MKKLVLLVLVAGVMSTCLVKAQEEKRLDCTYPGQPCTNYANQLGKCTLQPMATMGNPYAMGYVCKVG
jgi:hypothetical protein